MIASAGDRARRRFVEFFVAEIRNPNTRRAYVQAVGQFCLWCDRRGLSLDQITPIVVASHIEELTHRYAPPTVKQRLAAIRVLGDYLVTGHVLATNPAAAVRGPRYSLTKGKTPVLSAEQTRELLDSIDVTTIGGLRDRALIGVLVFSFARIGAVVKMNGRDYYANGKRYWLRLHEKGGKFHEVPVHHRAEEYLDAYVVAAGIRDDQAGPLFRTLDRRRQLSDRRLDPNDALRAIKRYARALTLPVGVCNHTFRATGITAYMQNGGTLENAARIAAHSSTRTTQLYNRVNDQLSLDEIERVII
jgi:integrase/recombinase XerD